ncbi:MAG: hypothetical protein AB7N29_23860 [Vicinamibacterales bacterium]
MLPLVLVVFAAAAQAQGVPMERAGQVTLPGQGAPADGATVDAPVERALGVLPSFLTSNGEPGSNPLPPGGKIALALRTSFDLSMYPLVGVMAAANPSYGPGLGGYAKQYAASFTDNVAGNLLTSGLLPAAFGQDPRYYRRAHGSIGARAAYAASRGVVGYGDSGKPRVNASELLGTSVAATLSNLYYPRDRRTVADTVTRFGYQLLWDALANELQEFWPDISRRFRRRK